MRELAFLNKGITINLTDLREKDEDGKNPSDVFYSEGGLREFAKYLDRNRESLIPNVVYFTGLDRNWMLDYTTAGQLLME